MIFLRFKRLFVHFFVFAIVVIAITECYDPKTCIKCRKMQICKPPDCFCCRDELPLPRREIPQMVFFTFDDAVTPVIGKFYKRLFDQSRTNPNGCPIKMTLFISHSNTVYELVKEFYQKGMEIASHSVTHSHMNARTFMNEAKRQRQNLARLAEIPESEIVGWRSPFLEPIGDAQPDILKKLGYQYDATLTLGKKKDTDNAPVPFTLDYGWPYDCKIKPCPKKAHTGFWEVPVITVKDYLKRYECVYVDGCNNPPPDEESAFQFLWENFKNYYESNRAPFGINMHASWFYYPHRFDAMDRFIRKLVKLNDVYIVSVKQVIEWLKKPTPLARLGTFKPWGCGLKNVTIPVDLPRPAQSLPQPQTPRIPQWKQRQERWEQARQRQRNQWRQRQHQKKLSLSQATPSPSVARQRQTRIRTPAPVAVTPPTIRFWWRPPSRQFNSVPQHVSSAVERQTIVQQQRFTQSPKFRSPLQRTVPTNPSKNIVLTNSLSGAELDLRARMEQELELAKQNKLKELRDAGNTGQLYPKQQRSDKANKKQGHIEDQNKKESLMTKIQLEKQKLEAEMKEQQRLKEQKQQEAERLKQKQLEMEMQRQFEVERLKQEQLKEEQLKQQQLREEKLRQKQLEEEEKLRQQQLEADRRKRLEEERLRKQKQLEEEQFRLQQLAVQEKIEAEKQKQKRLEEERARQQQLEAEKLKQQKLEAQRLQQQEVEAERLKQQQLEAERLKKQQLESERLKQQQLEAERLRQQQLETERLKKQQLEAERLKQQHLEAERLKQKQLEVERLKQNQLEAELLKQQQLEAERLRQQQLQAERLKQQQLEAERIKQQQLEAERLRQQQLETERLKQQQLETERLKQQQLEAESLKQQQLDAERLKQQQLEAERLRQQQLEAERLKQHQLEAERLKQQKLEAERFTQQKFEAERLKKQQQLETERLKQQQLEAERLNLQQLEAEQLKQSQLEAELLKQQQLDTERFKKQQLEAKRLTQQLEAEKLKQQLEAERLKNQQMEASRLKQHQLVEEKRRPQEQIVTESIQKQRRKSIPSYWHQSIWDMNLAEIEQMREPWKSWMMQQYLRLHPSDKQLMSEEKSRSRSKNSQRKRAKTQSPKAVKANALSGTNAFKAKTLFQVDHVHHRPEMAAFESEKGVNHNGIIKKERINKYTGNSQQFISNHVSVTTEAPGTPVSSTYGPPTTPSINYLAFFAPSIRKALLSPESETPAPRFTTKTITPDMYSTNQVETKPTTLQTTHRPKVEQEKLISIDEQNIVDHRTIAQNQMIPNTKEPKSNAPFSLTMKTTSRPVYSKNGFRRLGRTRRLSRYCLQGDNCVQPNCFCKTTKIPGSLKAKDIPQIVYLTFDGDINFHSYDEIAPLFSSSRRNPNGCKIGATLFISDTGTNYKLVRDLHNLGAELAMNGLQSTVYTNSQQMKQDIQVLRSRISTGAGITESDIQGWRSPQLRSLGDIQFDIMKNQSLYDSTIVFNGGKNADDVWPFTLDYGWKNSCDKTSCPRKRHAGVWEVPLIPLRGLDGSTTCTYVDGCNRQPQTEAETLKFLMDNFNLHYKKNRTPLGIRLQQRWFHWYYRKQISGLFSFIDKILKLKDVYIVSIADMLEWVQNPTPLSKLDKFSAWKC